MPNGWWWRQWPALARFGRSASRLLPGRICDWRRVVTAALDRVEHERPALLHGTQGLEKEFLEIGRSLDRLSLLGDRVVGDGEELLRLASGQTQGDDVLRGSIDRLQEPIEVLAANLGQAEEVVAHLRRHQAMIAEVRHLEGTLNDIVSPLRFIQTAFRIESAGLVPETRAVFVALTRDIEQLHAQVVGLFAEQFQSLARAEAQIAALVKRLGPQIRVHQKRATDKRLSIEQALVGLRESLEENARRDIRLADAARGLQSGIGEVVQAVQFQDITSQKLHHVDAAIREMSARLAELPGRGPVAGESAWPEACAFFSQGARIQVAQIRSVQAELKQAEARIHGALEAIVNRADSVDHECLTLRNFRTISIEGDGVVQVVLNSLEDFNQVVEQTCQIQAEVHETLVPLAGMASNLTGVILGLSQSIRLIALNAQIQAAHIGAGTGLEVLSQRTCQIADQATAANAEAARALEQLIGGFDALVEESRRLQDAVQAQRRWVHEEGGAIRDRLHAYRDRTLALFMDLGTVMESIRGESKQMRATLLFEQEACAELARVAESLEGFGAAVLSVAGDAVNAVPANGGEMERRYTMASEREAHARAMDPLAKPSPPGPAEAAVVPLVAAPAAMVETAGAREVAEAVVPPAPAVAAGGNAGLGDNVELF